VAAAYRRAAAAQLPARLAVEHVLIWARAAQEMDPAGVGAAAACRPMKRPEAA
jgi:hypothetical protein